MSTNHATECRLKRLDPSGALLSALMIYFVTCGGTFVTSLTAVGKIQGQIVTTILWIALLVALIRTKEITRFYRSLSNPVFILMGLLAASLVISAQLSFFPRFSLEVSFQSIWYLGLAWMTYLYCRSDEHRERVVTAVLAGGVVVLTFALMQFAGWLFDPHRDTSPAGQRVMVATMNSHNDLAGYLVLLFPLVLSRCLPTSLAGMEAPTGSRASVLALRCYSLYALLLCFGILFTYSRCGWVGVVAATLAFLAVSFATGQLKSLVELLGSQKFLLLGVMALLLAALFFSPHQWFLERVRTMLTGSDYGSVGRLAMWKRLLAMWQDRPLWGWGSGLLPIIYPRYIKIDEGRELIFHAHNLLLQYAADGGAVALVLFLGTMGVGFFQGFRTIDPSKDLHVARRQTALLASLVGFLFFSLFNSTQAIPAITGTSWVLLGLMVSRCCPDCRVSRAYARELVPPVFLLLAGVAVYSYYTAPWSKAHLKFDHAMQTRSLQGLNETIELDQDFSPYYTTLDSLCRRGGWLFSDKERPLRYNGEDALVRNNAAWLRFRRLPSSKWLASDFDDCIRLDPSLPTYRLSKAVTRLAAGDAKRAEKELITIATKLARKPPVTWLFLAQIHETRGEWDQARADLETGLNAPKLGKYPGYQMRVRYRRIGLEDESVDALPNCDSTDLLNWEMAKVLERLGRRDEAWKYHAESLRLNSSFATDPPTGFIWEQLDWDRKSKTTK
ncbi:MAG: O-antigen ligase family protein [Armatimonadetes bacterium]|nr:O-antigen ligase family protein [Armatimonadota bacterium]